jgi:hypothetical protein
MACDITKGRLVSCKDAVGGLNKVYFINYDDMPDSAYTYDTDGETITAVTGSPSAYEYDLHLGNDLTQNIQSSPQNGTTYFEQVLSLTLKKLTKEDNKEVRQLAYGHPKIMVLDKMGNYMLVGAIHGADVTGGTAVTGNEMGDLNGYTLTFTGMEPTLANFYTGDFDTEFTVVQGT